jgi:hypothetical protein
MHAPKALRLGETVLRPPAAKGSEHVLRSQEVDGPIGPHLAELLPQNAARFRLYPARCTTLAEASNYGLTALEYSGGRKPCCAML